MLSKFLLYSGIFSLALFILTVSVFRIAQVKYVFSQSPSSAPLQTNQIKIDYNLAYPGTILPDSIFWPLKALRDKVWLALTPNPSKKAELYLLIADKRLCDARMLFEDKKPDIAVSVLTKAEKYLALADGEERIAHSEGMNTTDFLQKYMMATLKHRQVLDDLLAIAPEDARPLVVKTEDYPKKLYESARNGLLEAGANVPQNPFREN